jgi:hypothetical protein
MLPSAGSRPCHVVVDDRTVCRKGQRPVVLDSWIVGEIEPQSTVACGVWPVRRHASAQVTI